MCWHRSPGKFPFYALNWWRWSYWLLVTANSYRNVNNKMLFYDTSEKPQDFFTVVKMWQKENKMKPVRLTLSEKHQYLGGFKASFVISISFNWACSEHQTHPALVKGKVKTFNHFYIWVSFYSMHVKYYSILKIKFRFLKQNKLLQ